MSSLRYNTENTPVDGPPTGTPVNADGVYIDDDNCLVVPDGYVSQGFCLVTGVPVTSAPRSYKFRLKNPDGDRPIGLFGLGLLGALIVLAGQRRYCKISFCLNDDLLRRRQLLIVVSIVAPVLAFVLPFPLLNLTQNPVWLLIFPVLLITGMIAAWRKDEIVKTRKVSASFVWFRGLQPAIMERIYNSGKSTRIATR